MRFERNLRVRGLVAVMGLVAAAGGWIDATAGDVPYVGVVTEQNHRCGRQDHPERGIQGNTTREEQRDGTARKGYNCGLTKLGFTELTTEGRKKTSNGNIAWARECAYIAGPGAVSGEPKPEATHGIAVVKVSDDGTPTHVRTLRFGGSRSALETLHAVETPERAILVVGQYGNSPGDDVNPMDVYDVSDCANPVHLDRFGNVTPASAEPTKTFTYNWPANIHNLTVSGNGRYVFATQPLQVIDLAPLFDGDATTEIEYLGNLDEATPSAPVSPGPLADLDDPVEGVAWGNTRSRYLSHEAWPNADGTKLYIGGQLPAWETFTILDIADWLQRKGPPEIISQVQGRGHSVRTATIKGKPYVLHSEEAVFGPTAGCLPETANPFVGPAQPWLTDISDEENPVLVSQFGLEINEPEHCPEALRSNVRAGVHYHDVDNAADTTFVMASMWNAGVRVFDVRDPSAPVEVAYFNPGVVGEGDGVLDHAWGHVRWLPERNQMWFATSSGGFWVVEMQHQVRRHLGLHKKRVPAPRDPDGHPGRTGLVISAPTAAVVDPAAYCTVSPVRT